MQKNSGNHIQQIKNGDAASHADPQSAGGYIDSATTLITALHEREKREERQDGREQNKRVLDAKQSDMHPYADLRTLAEMIDHGAAVAHVLKEWGASEQLQAAAMLHSLVWNCVLPAEDVLASCGEDVLFLCQAYREKMAYIPSCSTDGASASRQPRQWRGKMHILQRIKYFMLAYESFDLAFLGAADLWCHFRFISRSGSMLGSQPSSQSGNKSGHQNQPKAALKSDSQRNLSLRRQIEIVEQICKPYFEFLGLHEIKEEFDLWLFEVQEQNSKKRSTKKQSAKKQSTKKQTDNKESSEEEGIKNEITNRFSSLLPTATICYRPFLHLHTPASDLATDSSSNSSSTKLITPQKAHNINLVVDTVDQCYQALGTLHQCYTPVDGGTHDHLRGSRLNGYRMLQTAVVAPIQFGESGAPQRVRINFHICTREMDAINRWGLAAVYLQDHPDDELPTLWWRAAATQYKRIQSSELGSLPELLYVFSPQGQLFEFNLGCTVVDYAYRVHSRLADHCRRFTVNGEAVEPATVLHHLDLVELQYDPYTAGPTRVWLNAARTQRARTAINRFLRNHRQDIYLGQQKMDKELKELEEHYGFHIPQHRVEQALSQIVRKWRFQSINDLMGEIATSRLQPHRVLHPLFAKEIVRQIEMPAALKIRPHMVEPMKCCRPRVGEDIIGLLDKRGEVITKLKVHTQACADLKELKNTVPLKWRLQPELQEVTRIVMRAQDDHGLLGDAVSQIYEMDPSVTLHKSEALARYGEAHLSFIVETENREVLEELADALRRLPDRDIIEVRHMSLSLTEREEFGQSMNGNPTANPYTRSPVYEEDKFFGRKTEIERILDLLRSREDVVWVRGHKRVGKTSLLQHLKNTRLDPREFLPVFYDFQMLSDMNTETICFELARAVYEALQDNRQSVNEIGAPLRELFHREPINHFISYLRNAQDHANIGRIVLLIDEFSRTTDTYHQAQKQSQKQSNLHRIDPQFFYQWRGMIQEQRLNVSFLIVVQQQALDNIRDRVQGGDEDPNWPLMELGEQIELRPLAVKDAHELIERPMRNYLDLAPQITDQIYSLTGGGPFLIHTFCSKLMTRMSQLDQQEVADADVQSVVMEFMSPNESIFAHLLDLTRNVASKIADQLATMLEEQIQADLKNAHMASVTWDDLHAALPDIPPEQLTHMLQGMCKRDILIEVEPNSWRFASLLFQQWLALNQGAR